MSVNKVILVGNVGRDPETRHLDKGVAVANFSLATTETYTAKTGEKVSTTEWHNIVAWRGLAEVAEKYVKKGSQLYIEGRIRTRAWDQWLPKYSKLLANPILVNLKKTICHFNTKK